MKVELSTIWHMLREDYKVHLFKIIGADVDAEGKKIESVIEINLMCCHWDDMSKPQQTKIYEYFKTVSSEW